MDALDWLLVSIIAVQAVLLAFRRRKRAPTNERLPELARAVEESDSADWQGQAPTVTTLQQGSWQLIEVRHPGIPKELVMRPTGGVRMMTPADRPIGHIEFDHLIHAAGPHTLLLSVLDATTRAVLLEAFRDASTRSTTGVPALEVEQGCVRARVHEERAAYVLERASDHAVAVAKALIVEGRVSERLARVAVEDPLPEVRQSCVEQAIVALDPEAARRLLHAALQDPAPAVREVAKQALLGPLHDPNRVGAVSLAKESPLGAVTIAEDGRVSLPERE